MYQLQVSCADVAGTQTICLLQDFPEIPKQAEWKCKRMPDKIDWDGLIADVLQRGTDVPEIPWFKPGEDAAYDVSKMLYCQQTPKSRAYVSACTLYCCCVPMKICCCPWS